MAKKGFGKFVAFAAIAGATAAGISYFTKYKAFRKELQKDFHDFEDEDLFEDDEDVTPVPDRTYVALNSSKDEFLVAASDMVDAAKGMAGAAKDIIRDTIAIVTDTAGDAASVAADTVKSVKEKAEDAADELKEEAEELKEEVKETASEISEEIKEEVQEALEDTAVISDDI
ncbi:MAG: hypothetical protein ACLTKI_01635 [Lachnospiraceae bacterium]